MPCEKMIVKQLPKDIVENAIYSIDQPNPNSYTHNFFKYPCKFIPEIPRWAIMTYGKESGSVLDPFAGSGTTLVESCLQGIDGYACEIDEVAKLLIRVKTSQLTVEQISEIRRINKAICEDLSSDSYAQSEIVLPAIRNLYHWFKEDILRQLGHMYYLIVQAKDKKVEDFLLVCMASIIKRVSNCDDISPKPYVSNNVEKVLPSVIKLFDQVVEKNIASIEALNQEKIATVSFCGDATKIDLPDDSVDLVVTSPPYINAFDYVRTLRLENLWLNLSTEEALLEKKKKYVGTETIHVKTEKQDLRILDESPLLASYFKDVALVDERRALVIKKFFEEMKKNLCEVRRVLKSNGYYVLVIGNSSIRKIEIESWSVLKDLATQCGFSYETHFAYEIRNPYIRIPRGNQGGKISLDHVLVLKREG